MTVGVSFFFTIGHTTKDHHANDVDQQTSSTHNQNENGLLDIWKEHR